MSLLKGNQFDSTNLMLLPITSNLEERKTKYTETWIEYLLRLNFISKHVNILSVRNHTVGDLYPTPLSIKFSHILPNFMYLLSTKPMAKCSRAPGQLPEGQWVEHKAEF